MDQIQKEQLLGHAQGHVAKVQNVIKEKRIATQKSIYTMMSEARSLSRGDQISAEGVAVHLTERVEEMKVLEQSPYFVKCEVQSFEYKNRTYYFSKFQYADEHIYSWVAPAAMLRFEKPR